MTADRHPEPPEPESHAYPETEEKECVHCGRTAEIPLRATHCDECSEAKAFAQIETPEGGWPRGSDMDRI